MRRILINNPVLRNTEKSGLTSAYAVGVTTLSVLNNFAFAANDLLVVGELGEEQTELKKCNSITGSGTLNLASTLNFAHAKDTPVYKVPWDFVSIEGRSSSTGTFAEITQSGIQWDKPQTIYYHTSGDNNWQYRFRFFNSVLSIYSDYSPTISGTGYVRGSVGYMVRQVRKLTGDEKREIIKTDAEIIRFFNTAQDIIRGVKSDWNFLKVTDSTITTIANTKVYGVPTGVGGTGNIDSIRYQYNDGGSSNIVYNLKYLPEKEFDLLDRDQRRTPDDYVTYYTIQESDSGNAFGYIRVDPIPKTTGRGTFIVRYFKKMVDLDTVDDITPVPLPNILEDFAIAQIEKIKGNESKSQIYENLFYGKQVVYRRVINIDSGISLLLNLDNNQVGPAGQPMSLSKFRGQKGVSRIYNSRFTNMDYVRENYFSVYKP